MQEHNEAQPVAASAEEEEASLGSLLKSARVERQLELDDIAGEMRVEPKVLEALESDEFDSLGEPVFVKGYIKQYGRHLGLNYDDLLAAYYRQSPATEVDIRPMRSIKMRDDRQIAAWIIAGLVLLLVAVLLFVWWLGEDSTPLVLNEPSSDPVASLESAPVATPAGDRSLAPRISAPQPIPGTADGSRGNEVAEQSPSADLRSAAQSESVSEEPQSSEPIASVAEDIDTVEPEVVVSAGESGLVTLELQFEADCWTEIRDARGMTLFYDLSQAGDALTVEGMPPFNVFLGNANGVRLTIDGSEFAIPTRSRRDNLAHFIVSAPQE
jgi:cytoskeleton protein RodZ